MIIKVEQIQTITISKDSIRRKFAVNNQMAEQKYLPKSANRCTKSYGNIILFKGRTLSHVTKALASNPGSMDIHSPSLFNFN